MQCSEKSKQLDVQTVYVILKDFISLIDSEYESEMLAIKLL